MLDDFYTLDVPTRRAWYRTLNPRDMGVLLTTARKQDGSQYAIWQQDPVGFVADVLGDTTWGKQDELLESVRDNERTVVPATHAPGKTFIGSRAAAWFIAVHPIGTAKVLTTAPKMRQVEHFPRPAPGYFVRLR